MSRPGAEARLQRILAVIPWVAGADGPRIAEICARFGYASEKELRDDLGFLIFCGVPPYSPDALIEVDVEDGRMWIRYADWFSRPLRFTPAEALSLVASSAALVEPGDTESALARGLAKLAGALGLDAEAVDVTLGSAPAGALADLQDASRTLHQVEIEYYAFGRDEITHRVIDPHLVYSGSGQWYVAAYCHLAGSDRLFRVDRIRTTTILPTTFGARPGAVAPPVYAPEPDDPVVVLDLEPGAAWVATQYPTRSVTELGRGRTRVELWASGEAWLARLLLRLGPDVAVIEGDGSPARRFARQILGRYRDGPGTR